MLSPILPLVDSLPLRFDVAFSTATETLASKITDIIRTELSKMPKPECHPHTCSVAQWLPHPPSHVHPQEVSTSSSVDYTSPRKKRRLADLDSAPAAHDGPPSKPTFSGDDDPLERTTTVPPSNPPSLIDHQLPAAATRKLLTLNQHQQPPSPQLRKPSRSFVALDYDGHKPPSSHGHSAAMGDVDSTPVVSLAQSSKLSSSSVSVSAASPANVSPATSARTKTHAQMPLASAPWSPTPAPFRSVPPQAAPSTSVSSTSGSTPRPIAAATTSGLRNPPAFANTTNTSRPNVEHSGSRTRMNTPDQLRERSNPLKRSIAGMSVFTSLCALLHLDLLMIYEDAMFTPPVPASSADPHTHMNMNTTNPRRTPFDAILVNATPDATPSSTISTRTLSAKQEFTLGGGSRPLTSTSSVGAGGGSVKAVGEGRPKPAPSLKDRRMQGLAGSAVRFRFRSCSCFFDGGVRGGIFGGLRY